MSRSSGQGQYRQSKKAIYEHNKIHTFAGDSPSIILKHNIVHCSRFDTTREWVRQADSTIYFSTSLSMIHVNYLTTARSPEYCTLSGRLRLQFRLLRARTRTSALRRRAAINERCSKLVIWTPVLTGAKFLDARQRPACVNGLGAARSPLTIARQSSHRVFATDRWLINLFIGSTFLKMIIMIMLMMLMMLMMTVMTRWSGMTDSSKIALAIMILRSVNEDSQMLCHRYCISRLSSWEQQPYWSVMWSKPPSWSSSSSWWSANAATSRVARRNTRSIILTDVLRHTHIHQSINQSVNQSIIICLGPARVNRRKHKGNTNSNSKRKAQNH